ncbi:MAG TPA: Rrf2 family transcriptional regulator [Thermoanaerobaculia bacterium]|nr:Rrf2 family transcriptional regulator [Thermoanaerobaculia bacterium]
MRLTAASEYGCLALLTIAQSSPNWCKRQMITERFDIPASYLEQILHKFATAGIVVSRRGSEGGFRLARAADQITIAQIVRTVEGALAPVRSVSDNFYQPSPIEASPAFRQLFRSVRDAVAEILEHTTLEDIVENEHLISQSPNSGGTRRTSRPSPRGAGARKRS